jgi:hypothetical protein
VGILRLQAKGDCAGLVRRRSAIVQERGDPVLGQNFRQMPEKWLAARGVIGRVQRDKATSDITRWYGQRHRDGHTAQSHLLHVA